jgi:hypothetical protein
MIDFKDRKIIYTGAAGGLGLPTTLTFLIIQKKLIP